MNDHGHSIDRRKFLHKTVGIGAGAFFLGQIPDGISQPLRSDGSVKLASATNQVAKWEVEGRYIDACRCHVPCPCHFGMLPDYDPSCDAASVYQIEQGHYGDVRLDDLLAIVVLSEFERFYLDETADQMQEAALEKIIRALTGSFLRTGIDISDNLEIGVHPITARLTDEEAKVTIPGVLDIQSVSLKGGDGISRIEMSNLDLGPGWMQSVWAGQSNVYTHNNGEKWDHSGGNSYFGRFSANSNMAVIKAAADVRQA